MPLINIPTPDLECRLDRLDRLMTAETDWSNLPARKAIAQAILEELVRRDVEMTHPRMAFNQTKPRSVGASLALPNRPLRLKF